MVQNSTGYDDVTIYMSGSIRGLNAKEVVSFFDENTKYVKDALNEAGIKCKVLSPVRGKIPEEDESGNWKTHFSLKEIVARDERDIALSDILLIQTGDEPSDGTWLEFGYAHYVCKIPVIMVAPKRKVGDAYSWSNEKATYIGSTLKECVDWIIEYWMAQ